jgi:hypothetical protein
MVESLSSSSSSSSSSQPSTLADYKCAVPGDRKLSSTVMQNRSRSQKLEPSDILGACAALGMFVAY